MSARFDIALRYGPSEMKLIIGLTIFTLLLAVAVSNSMAILGIDVFPLLTSDGFRFLS